jgi:hypothetical protein
MWLGGNTLVGRWILVVACSLGAYGTVCATPAGRLAEDAAAGAITPEQYLLYRFEAGFDPDRLPERYRDRDGDDAIIPEHCGTPLVREYLAVRASLSAATREAIDGYLTVPDGSDTLTSAAGHFRLSWFNDGDNAVPLADVEPADGIPDFIAMMAGYLEFAWSTEIDSIGFVPPPVTPVEVAFRRMRIYGYATPVDPTLGQTRLVLHSTFSRFPPNDDPEGDVAGSAKVTAAHEFRHVSQYAGSRWSEGDWVELDGTWVEERVFEQVNDYQMFLNRDNPVRRPQIPLDGGETGTGSYEDAVFEIWLDSRFGDGVIRDFWARRSLRPTEEPLAAWDAVLALHGTSLAASWGDFTAWNYAVGGRAIAGIGYPDAADYPEGDLSGLLLEYPGEVSGSVEHLAAAPVRLGGFEQLGDHLLSLSFDGDEAPEPLSLSLHVQTIDGGGWQDQVSLDRHGDARLVLPVPASRLASVGVVIGNGNTAGPAVFWTLAVDTLPGPPPPPTARLLGIEPNPCNPVTWLTCAMTSRDDATLDIVDPSGRRVRRVWSGSLATGTHRFQWDGRDDAGRPAAAGVYVARLSTARGTQGRKLTLVR